MNNRRADLSEEDDLRVLIKAAARTLDDQKFDDRVMLKIQQELEVKRQIANQLRISLQLFVIASLSGIVLAVVYLIGFNVEELKQICAAIMLLFILLIGLVTYIGNYQRLITKYSQQQKVV